MKTQHCSQVSSFKLLFILSLSLLISGCLSNQSINESTAPQPSQIVDGPPDVPFDASKIKPAQPKWEPRSRYGNHSPYTVAGVEYSLRSSRQNYEEVGIASWYGSKFHGRRTSSWEPYDMFQMTAAHKTLPLPSYLEVTNLENGRSTVVRVNDRGPFHPQRIVDLSYAAAHVLGITEKGTAKVKIKTIALTNPQPNGSQLLAKAEQAAPSSANRDLDNGQLYLQLGAFENLDTALALQSQIIQFTQTPVSISRIERQNKTLHRVQIGPFDQWQDLADTSATLKEKQIGNPVVKNW